MLFHKWQFCRNKVQLQLQAIDYRTSIHPITSTMANPRAGSTFICRSCRHHLFTRPQRTFSSFPALFADNTNTSDSITNTFANLLTKQPNTYTQRSRRPPPRSNANVPVSISAALDGPVDYSFISPEFESNEAAAQSPPHRLHVYATKHNTHITFVQPAKSAAETAHLRSSTTKASSGSQSKQVDVLLSLSAGNLGFKKAGRGSYDAAFQLAAFTLKQIQEKGMHRDVKHLEVVLRGFGAGREAVTKALLGTEGRFMRARITSVADATRLKQGGPRGKKPRRLG